MNLPRDLHDLMGPIVCLGDSVTAAGWPTRLQETLHEVGFTTVEVVNAGVKGNTSGQGVRRFAKDVAVRRPAVVFIQFGFNDCNVVLNGPRPRVSREDYQFNLETLIRLSREAGAIPVVIINYHTLVHRVLPDGRAYEEHSREYSAIADETADRQGTEKVDMRLLFPGDHLTLKEALAEDGIHLAPAGVEAYARILREFIISS